VGGGDENRASEASATVGGGQSNEASGARSTVGGGHDNEASGESATVPGGDGNRAQGQYSFAAGHNATAAHDGAFVWSDSRGGATAQHEDQFLVKAYGGSRFEDGTGLWVELSYQPSAPIDTSTGAYLSGGGVWTDASDRDLKENLEPVDAQETLARLVDLPITTWNYKAVDDDVRHMGPMAQDFYEAFQLGADERHIASLDANGVALTAIKGLQQRNQALEEDVRTLQAENEKLQAENAVQQDQIGDLEARLTALEEGQVGSPLRQGLWPSLGMGMLLLAGIVVWQRREREEV
jgi:hypothetical protein